MQSTTYETLNRWLDTKPYVRQPLAMRRWLRRQRLSGTEYAVLDLVYERTHFQPDCATKLTIREIAQDLGVDNSTVTRAIKDLRSRGLIDKKQITGGAVTFLTLTEDMRWYVELSSDRNSQSVSNGQARPNKRARKQTKKPSKTTRKTSSQGQTAFGFEAGPTPSPQQTSSPVPERAIKARSEHSTSESTQSQVSENDRACNPEHERCSNADKPPRPSHRPRRPGGLFRSILQSGQSQGVDAKAWLEQLQRESEMEQLQRPSRRQDESRAALTSTGSNRRRPDSRLQTNKTISSADVERMIRYHGNNTRRQIETLVPEVLYSINEGAQSHLPSIRALRAAGAMIAQGAWSTPYGYYDSHYCNHA